jgi:predicted metalloprotease with PDZ domain
MKATRLFTLWSCLLAIAACSYADCAYCNCRSINDYLPDWNGGNCVDSDCRSQCTLPHSVAHALLPGFGLRDHQVVDWVSPGSPASQAGLQPGDVIAAVNGAFLPRVCGSEANKEVDVYSVHRGSSVLTLKIGRATLGDLIAQAAWASPLVVPIHAQRAEDRRVPSHLYLSGLVVSSRGPLVRVVDVVPGTPAAEAAIRSGDLIAVDGTTQTKSLRKVEGSDSAETVRFLLLRDGSLRPVSLHLRSAAAILRALSTDIQPTPTSVGLSF